MEIFSFTTENGNTHSLDASLIEINTIETDIKHRGFVKTEQLKWQLLKLALLKLTLAILEPVHITISRNVFVNRVKKSLLSIKFIFWRVALFSNTRQISMFKVN